MDLEVICNLIHDRNVMIVESLIIVIAVKTCRHANKIKISQIIKRDLEIVCKLKM